MNKKEARAVAKENKNKMNKDEIDTYSKEISATFLEQNFYSDATIIYVYLAYNQEIDTRYIIERAWNDGKRVAVPKVLSEERMEFYEITSFDDIELGYCDIPEPSGNTSIVDEKEVLMIMPGLAFDKNRNRVGYGGGFYDRYLERYEEKGTKFFKVSLAYDFQIFDEIDIEEHDKKVDAIITKSLVI